MGNSESNTNSSKDNNSGGGEKSNGSAHSNAVDDPCEVDMQRYLKCVDSHPQGLSDGDECKQEADAYKLCRTQMKSRKQSS
jgi:hypothetical protein